jgi:NAD(P)-dependent dehydrogenase (short-subunit alcohol dehydrogenase family)
MNKRKVALVTGCSRGIGQEITLKLLQSNYYVLGIYFNSEEAAKDMQKHKNIEMIKCDLSNRAELKKLTKKLENIQFDAIVNCAGVIEYDDFENFDLNNWDRTMAVNLTAPLILVQEFQNQLKRNASVVNISSTDHMFGGISSFSYAASKAGLVSLTKSMAIILGRKGINVNAVAPGWVETDMVAKSGDKTLEIAAKFNPMNRNGNTNDIASTVKFLLSDEAKYINGQTIVVDGGYTLQDYTVNAEAEFQ